MADQNILILGNKHYKNINLNAIVDSFDIIYRFNLACPGRNNGTRFGRLAMCSHVYKNFVSNPLSKKHIIEKYQSDYTAEFVSEWYDFFQENKEKFDEIFYQECKKQQWNAMLGEYGSPHRFSKMATTGYSTIFKSLQDGNENIYVFGFTLCDKEVRRTAGVNEKIVEWENQGGGCHSFSEEIKILNWLHNNKKIDASLCMLEDIEEPTLKTNSYNVEPSEFVLDLLNRYKA